MKQNCLLGLLIMVVCCVSGCGTYKKTALLSELSSDDITQITILALKDEKMVNIADSSEINRVLTSIQELPLYVKTELATTYDTDLIQFTLKHSSGKDIIVEVIEPWISYNHVWYACDSSVCQQLSGLAYELMP